MYTQVIPLHIQKEELKSPAPSTELLYAQEELLDNKTIEHKISNRQSIELCRFFVICLESGCHACMILTKMDDRSGAIGKRETGPAFSGEGRSVSGEESGRGKI